jgi:DNA repair protein RadD
VLPTGGGKTVNAAALIEQYTSKLRSVLIFAHTREIVRQTSDKLKARDIQHGAIMAGLEDLERPQALVQVASIQTLTARCIRTKRQPLPAADLVIVDESHHILAKTYQKLIQQITEIYPNASVLGLTATPCRGDGRGLGGTFDVLVEGPQVQELIELGFLVRTTFYAPPEAQMQRLVRGVDVVGADYNQKRLGERMDRAPLIGDIVTQYAKYGQGRKAICYATTVAHSVHIAERFNEVGIKCEHIDGTTPKDERDETLNRLAIGETQIVTNVGVLTEGFDAPVVGCIILARPTKSFGLYRQMVGRGLRPAEGKSDCIVLDHSGAVYRHGLPEDPVEWTLDPDLKVEATAHTKAANNFESSKRLVECQCGAIRKGGEPCPSCGFLPKRPASAFVCHDGDLGLVTDGHASERVYSDYEKHLWHGMLVHIAQQRNYKPGWVAHQYKKKFGVFPGWEASPEPVEPTPEVLSWVRSRMIAYAKGQAKAMAS